ncbi:MAG TPA: NAD(P)H-dependent oxidoreductase [Solirubrobacterales bacterium]|nr:NAD(P)H-dependent oxidoreductase [Solirubrobacterales bacterium]
MVGRPNLMIVIASTRPGRIGLPVGEWFAGLAREHGGWDVDVADLAEIDLPFMDEPKHPRLREYTHQHTKDWSAQVEAADAFVFVHPEYNYGMTAPLKNALDYLNSEWKYKPLGLVSYGGVSAGTRAAQMIKQVATTLGLFPIFEAVSIPFVAEFVGEGGAIVPNRVMEKATGAMLDELLRVSAALAQLREA